MKQKNCKKQKLNLFKKELRKSRKLKSGGGEKV